MDMKLLICTQVVDRNDPVLGFFHRWIEEFAKHCEHVIIVCLRKGVVTLPKNVEVIALGDRGRIVRAFELCAIALGRRAEYDAVFVHMNPEYLVAAGWLWRLLRKRTALWYVHKSVDPKLSVAEMFANVILTASKESFRLPSTKVCIMGHGIDTDFFAPDPSVVRGEQWLSAGRLMESKRHDIVIREAAAAGRELRIVGEGKEREALERLARECGADVRFLGGHPHEKMRDEYRRANLLIHRSETGSLDKVVLEAAACGCPVDSADPIIAALPLSPVYVREHHSLIRLIPRILKKMAV